MYGGRELSSSKVEILPLATAWIKLGDTLVCEISRHRYLPFPSPFLSIIGRVIIKKKKKKTNSLIETEWNGGRLGELGLGEREKRW